uniref:Uncharacterized protein n=1 Tax=Neobodo designis TaxID=312471 RepID=A0A7S1W5K0_NEODS
MAAVVRGVGYLATSLLAFLNAILVLFVRLGTFDSAIPHSAMRISGWITIFDGCVRLTDCDESECYDREMCAAFGSVDCPSESRTYAATQAIGIVFVVWLVPSVVMGALDALGKLPSVLCWSQRGLLITKAATNVVFCIVLLILVMNLLYSPDYCKRLELERIEGFKIGAVVYLVGATLIFNVGACLIAVCVPPDREPTESGSPKTPAVVAPPAASAAPPRTSTNATLRRRRVAAGADGASATDAVEMRAAPSNNHATGPAAVHSPVSGMPAHSGGGTFGTFDTFANQSDGTAST